MQFHAMSRHRDIRNRAFSYEDDFGDDVEPEGAAADTQMSEAEGAWRHLVPPPLPPSRGAIAAQFVVDSSQKAQFNLMSIATSGQKKGRKKGGQKKPPARPPPAADEPADSACRRGTGGRE